MFVRAQDRSLIMNMDRAATVTIIDTKTRLSRLKEYSDAGIQTVYEVEFYFPNNVWFYAACYIDRQSAEDALEALCDVIRDGRSYFEFPADYKFMEVENEGS